MMYGKFSTNPWTFDVKKGTVINMHKCSMWKPDTNNQTLLQEVSSNGETPEKKIQYSEPYKNVLGRD